MPMMTRITALTAASLLTLAGAAQALPRADAPIRGWSAMAGVPTADLLTDAQTMPISELAVGDQPYCAPNAEITQTLRHDFDEALVDTAGYQGMGTQLWGSEEMGTWTLVAPRTDDTSCIIASGIGYAPNREAATFYSVAGLE